MARFICGTLTAVFVLLAGSAGQAKAETPRVSGWETHPKIMQRNRDFLMTQEVQRQLPRLGTDFTVIAPASTDYNTWSHAIGMTDRWVNVPDAPPETPFLHLDALMKKSDYVRLAMEDTTFQPEMEKVIVFGALAPTGEFRLTVAVVQQRDGTYTAKLGQLAVVGFTMLDQMSGPAYGVVVGVYARPVKGAAAIAAL